MEFSLIGRELCITLTERDLVRLDLSYETFDWADASCRRVLSELIDVARSETGFSPLDGDLSVHLYAKKDGGACFYIRERAEREGVWRFASFDALCAAHTAGHLKNLTALYRLSDTFFAFVSGPDAAFSDYAVKLSRYARAAVKERGRVCRIDWLFEKENSNARTLQPMSELQKMPSARDQNEGGLRTGQ